jgi:hypothetical protein
MEEYRYMDVLKAVANGDIVSVRKYLGGVCPMDPIICERAIINHHREIFDLILATVGIWVVDCVCREILADEGLNWMMRWDLD